MQIFAALAEVPLGVGVKQQWTILMVIIVYVYYVLRGLVCCKSHETIRK